MRPCEECSANNWTFKKDGEATVATCSSCHHEVRFSPKGKGSVIKQECPNCGKKDVDRERIPFSIDNLTKSAYYDYHFICKKCNHDWPDEKTKRINAI
jgi:hypothetical protein